MFNVATLHLLQTDVTRTHYPILLGLLSDRHHSSRHLLQCLNRKQTSLCGHVFIVNGTRTACIAFFGCNNCYTIFFCFVLYHLNEPYKRDLIKMLICSHLLSYSRLILIIHTFNMGSICFWISLILFYSIYFYGGF